MFSFHPPCVFSLCPLMACGPEGRCGMWPWWEWAHPGQRSGSCSGLLNMPLIAFHVLLQYPKACPAENDYLPFANATLSYWNTVISSIQTTHIRHIVDNECWLKSRMDEFNASVRICTDQDHSLWTDIMGIHASLEQVSPLSRWKQFTIPDHSPDTRYCTKLLHALSHWGTPYGCY